MIARDLSRFPHEVSRMPYRDAIDLADTWREFPPVYVLTRVIARYSPQGAAEDMTPDDFAELRAKAGG